MEERIDLNGKNNKEIDNLLLEYLAQDLKEIGEL